MKIDVCISTIDRGLLSLIGHLPFEKDVRYLVGHQHSIDFDARSTLDQWREYANDRPDIFLRQLSTLGLSRSRNDLIRASSNDILLFSDDDVEYLPDFAQQILQAYQRESDADGITFGLLSKTRPRKYPKRAIRHNYISAMRVSSIGITVRRATVIDNDILFDENFGLGSPNPSGEEYIFVTDMIQQGLRVLSYPVPIVRHDHLTSGPNYYLDKRHIRAKGKMFERVFGPYLGVILILFFAIKKYPEYRREITFASFCANMLDR